MRAYIFGARATAAGLYKALTALYPNFEIDAFLVSSLDNNFKEIWGCPVRLLDDVSAELSKEDKSRVNVYVAVPELIHEKVKKLLQQQGFSNLIMLDSHLEADVMKRYFEIEGTFKSIHSLNILDVKGKRPEMTVYVASFYKDKPLKEPPKRHEYMKTLFLGCQGALDAGAKIAGLADYYDNTGEHISEKNPNRCEMTAHYWIWKNRIKTEDEYIGLYHYRRILNLKEDDLLRMKQNDVDVVLPYPMIHYPNSRVHHTWYVAEQDWNTMRKALKEIHPAYEARFDAIFDDPYFYNYNMMIAKKKVFEDYCAWLYPVLDRIEEISIPKGKDRADRYTAYLSESLTTLYFLYNKDRLRIFHAGRLIFT